MSKSLEQIINEARDKQKIREQDICSLIQDSLKDIKKLDKYEQKKALAEVLKCFISDENEMNKVLLFLNLESFEEIESLNYQSLSEVENRLMQAITSKSFK